MGVPVHPGEAVAIVRRLCASVGDHPPRVRHPAEIVLLPDGELLSGTGRERRLPATLLLATLLRALLDRAPLGHRASPALGQVVATGLGTLEGKRFHSVDAFAEALRPFEGQDPTADLRALFARWRAVYDLANDLPQASRTVQLVLLDASGSMQSSVVVRKPDRRRYERVVFNADGPAVVVVTNVAESASENRPAGADDEPFAVRELALASALLLITVPAGFWFGDSLAHLSRPSITAARSDVAAVSPDLDAAGPEPDVAPVGLEYGRAKPVAAHMSNLALMASDPSIPLTDWFLSVQDDPVSFRYTPIAGGGFIKKAKARIGAKTYNRQPSPNGKRVAFDSDHGGTRAVYVADRDGKNVRRVSGVGFARRPTWSPDGRRLAFERAGRRGTWNLWTVEVATGRLRQVSFDRTGRPSGVSWFPKSKTIGYSHGSEFRIVDVKNGNTRRFRAPRRSPIGSTAVSPDGRRIVFTGAEGTWLLDLSSRGREQMRRIPVDPSARAFSWAPDGKRLAYFSPRKGDWVVVQQ